jgi:hypothetical protein
MPFAITPLFRNNDPASVKAQREPSFARIRTDEVDKLADRAESDRDEQGVIGIDESELVKPEPIGPSKADSLRTPSSRRRRREITPTVQ